MVFDELSYLQTRKLGVYERAHPFLPSSIRPLNIRYVCVKCMVGLGNSGHRRVNVSQSQPSETFPLNLNIIFVHCRKGSSPMIKMVTAAQRQKEHVQFWGSGRDSE